MKQIKNVQDFLIGKTIVDTGKAKNYDTGIETISFIFSDGSFVLFGCHEFGIQLSPYDIDFDFTNKTAKYKNSYQKYNYAKFLFELKLIKKEEVEALKKEAEDSDFEDQKNKVLSFLERYPQILTK